MAEFTEYRPSSAEIEAFQRDGVVVLRGILPKSEVELARAAIDGGIANPGPNAEFIREGVKWGELHAPNASERNWTMFQDQFSSQRVPEMKQLVRDSCVGRIIAELMHSKTATFFYDHVICKKPIRSGNNDPTIIPWHQDLPYWNVDGTQIASVWIPVDRMSEQAAVTYILGSHKWGLYRPRHFVDASPYEGTEHFEDMPNIDNLITSQNAQAVSFAVEPGDVLAFDARIIHGSKGNIIPENLTTDSDDSCHDDHIHPSAHRRVALRFVGDDAFYCVRPGETAIPSPDMASLHGRKHNDKLTCEIFPLVWPK